MARPKRRLTDPDTDALRRTANTGSHIHTAELYGESETRGLREWARRAVLAGTPRR